MRIDRRRVLAATGLGVGTLVWPGLAHAAAGLANARAEDTPAAPRFGLCIGNTAYSRGVGELRHAGEDAALVAQSLRACGFTVPADAVVTNVRRAPLMAAVRAHVARVQAAGPEAVGFLYYAGHGAAAPTGRNYLIPIVDAEEMTDAIWDECVELPWLFETLGATPHAHIVSLDACRNSLRTTDRAPGNATYRNVAAEGREHNTFISYSTWEGQTASDGLAGAGNGPYAAALAAHMGVAQQSVLDMFDTVRNEVRARTQNVQEPMNLSRLNNSSRAMNIARRDHAGPDSSRLFSAGGAPLSVGLVVGADHTSNPNRVRLPGVRPDYTRMSAALQRCGYETRPVFNPDRTAFLAAINTFAERLAATRGEGVGVLHFSGYGESVGGMNYLFPTDFGGDESDPTNLRQNAISLREVLDPLTAARPRAAIILLDTCSTGARPDVSPIFGNDRVLVGYASMPGQGAREDPEGGYFTSALIAEMLAPRRRPLQEVLSAASARVVALSGGQQQPWFETSISAPIYFALVPDGIR